MSHSNYTQPHYYPTSHVTANVHTVPSMSREDSAQRKRPKYTRSKTGCLTCRVKKIKCDETKPICNRCTHGQRDCTWPDGVPVASNSQSRKYTTDDFDSSPSTAGSSGISDTSTPPTPNDTPPNGLHSDLGLPPHLSRRQSEPYLQTNRMPQQSGLGRHLSAVDSNLNSMMQNYPIQQFGPVPMIPEIASYPSQSRYNHDHSSSIYPLAHPVPRHVTSATRRVGDRFIPHPASGAQWNPPIMHSLDPIDPFFQNAQERNLVGYNLNDHHDRYQ